MSDSGAYGRVAGSTFGAALASYFGNATEKETAKLNLSARYFDRISDKLKEEAGHLEAEILRRGAELLERELSKRSFLLDQFQKSETSWYGGNLIVPFKQKRWTRKYK